MTMELELDLGQEFSPNQTLKVSPRLVAANYILELSSQELQQQIATELSENPALELVETPTCRVCGTDRGEARGRDAGNGWEGRGQAGGYARLRARPPPPREFGASSSPPNQ